MNWPLFQPLDLRNYLRICREFVWPFRYRLGGITLLASILVALTLAQPIFTRIFLDNVIGQRDFDLFVKLVVVMGTAIVLMIALDFYINYVICRTSTKINFTLRTRLYDHVLALPLDFHKSIDPGQLAYRILQDTSVIETAVSQLLINFFLNFLKAVAIGAYILYTDVWISIVVFIAIFGQIILVEKFRDPIYKLSLANKSAGEWLNAKLVKALESIEFVKIMSGEKTEYAQFFKGAHRQAALSIRYIITGKAANLASAFLSNIWSFVLLSYGTHLVLTGRLTIGALVSYLMIAGMLYFPIESLVKMVLGFQDVRASIVRFLEVYSAPIEASGPTRISFLESPKNWQRR